jgi:hypothetical protein
MGATGSAPRDRARYGQNGLSFAKSRDSSLFVGNDAAGQRLAVLLSLTRTAVACGINPEAYLTDMLIRMQTWPASRIDELLPWNWKPDAAEAGPPSGNVADGGKGL